MHFYTETFLILSAFGHVPTVLFGTGHNDSAASALQRHLAALTRDIRQLFRHVPMTSGNSNDSDEKEIRLQHSFAECSFCLL